jgi:hypothetical protein
MMYASLAHEDSMCAALVNTAARQGVDMVHHRWPDCDVVHGVGCSLPACVCAQLLLDDFAGHNIEATAALLDTAGRFLYRTPETHERMATMAEVSPLP